MLQGGKNSNPNELNGLTYGKSDGEFTLIRVTVNGNQREYRFFEMNSNGRKIRNNYRVENSTDIVEMTAIQRTGNKYLSLAVIKNTAGDNDNYGIQGQNVELIGIGAIQAQNPTIPDDMRYKSYSRKIDVIISHDELTADALPMVCVVQPSSTYWNCKMNGDSTAWLNYAGQHYAAGSAP